MIKCFVNTKGRGGVGRLILMEETEEAIMEGAGFLIDRKV